MFTSYWVLLFHCQVQFKLTNWVGKNFYLTCKILLICTWILQSFQFKTHKYLNVTKQKSYIRGYALRICCGFLVKYLQSFIDEPRLMLLTRFFSSLDCVTIWMKGRACQRRLQRKKMMLYFISRIGCFLNNWRLFCRIWPLTNSRMVGLLAFLLDPYFYLSSNIQWEIQWKYFFSYPSFAHSKYNLCTTFNSFCCWRCGNGVLTFSEFSFST